MMMKNVGSIRRILTDVSLATLSNGIRAVALGAVTVGLALGLCTTATAQFPNLGGHDFSAAGWLGGANQCAPCHDGPDWNHQASTATYTLSVTTLSLVGEPDGTSSKCLDCHDGTEAIDSFGGATGTNFIGGGANLGTDLTGHHPVSFLYTTALATAHGGLYDPATDLSGVGSTIDADLLESQKLQCTGCHDQHAIGLNNGLFKGWTGAGAPLCATCHKPDVIRGPGGHHIPDRSHPWASFRCTMCHGTDLTVGGTVAPACTTCHNDFASPNPPPAGHHGANRFDPANDCAGCHGTPDATTGVLAGVNWGSFSTPGCGDKAAFRYPGGVAGDPTQCHDKLWDVTDLPPVVDAGGPYTVVDGEELTLTATAIEGTATSLKFEWVFGDGSSPPFPHTQAVAAGSASDSIGHVFDVGPSPVYPVTLTGTVSVTDGVNDPVVTLFTVVVEAPPTPPAAADTWDVDVSAIDTTPGVNFGVTFQDDGTGILTGTKVEGTTTSVVFGMELSGVIFWMDIWMDTNSNVLWGVGNTYFGNVDRASTHPTMSGVVFDGSGGAGTFSGIRR